MNENSYKYWSTSQTYLSINDRGISMFRILRFDVPNSSFSIIWWEIT